MFGIFRVIDRDLKFSCKEESYNRGMDIIFKVSIKNEKRRGLRLEFSGSFVYFYIIRFFCVYEFSIGIECLI